MSQPGSGPPGPAAVRWAGSGANAGRGGRGARRLHWWTPTPLIPLPPSPANHDPSARSADPPAPPYCGARWRLGRGRGRSRGGCRPRREVAAGARPVRLCAVPRRAVRRSEQRHGFRALVVCHGKCGGAAAACGGLRTAAASGAARVWHEWAGRWEWRAADKRCSRACVVVRQVLWKPVAFSGCSSEILLWTLSKRCWNVGSFVLMVVFVMLWIMRALEATKLCHSIKTQPLSDLQHKAELVWVCFCFG